MSVRTRWRAHILRTSGITDSVRVLMLLLADHMSEDGRVSVPRSHLAQQLGRSERRINERMSAAVEAGKLGRVERGRVGRTATYIALLPGAEGADGRPLARGRIAAPSGGRTGAPYPHAQKGAPGGPAKPQQPQQPAVAADSDPALALLQVENEVEVDPGASPAAGAA